MIAYNSHQAAGASDGSGNSFNLSIDVGSDTILWAGVSLLGTTNDDNIAVTFNGAAMTKLIEITGNGSEYAALFYIVNPAAGTHNITVTCTSNRTIAVAASAYSGNATVSPVEDSKSNYQASVTSITTNPVTASVDDWSVAYVRNTGSGVQSGGTNATKRTSPNTFSIYDSNAALGAAGSKTVTVNLNTGDNVYMVSAVFKLGAAVTAKPIIYSLV